MGKYLYTVVCIFYTPNGITELDLYEVLKRLRINDIWKYNDMVDYHVYTGQAVRYEIKKVLRDVELNDETKKFYSKSEPYWMAYECALDLKAVSAMNNRSIQLRLNMSEKEFQKIYGRSN